MSNNLISEVLYKQRTPCDSLISDHAKDTLMNNQVKLYLLYTTLPPKLLRNDSPPPTNLITRNLNIRT